MHATLRSIRFSAMLCCIGPLPALAGDAFRLDLSPGPPQTVEDEKRRRFEQHSDCAAGTGDARTCEMLEQQARQRQLDEVRRSASPAGVPPPANPNPTSERGLPLPGGR
jgi:hypothetical protein